MLLAKSLFLGVAFEILNGFGRVLHHADRIVANGSFGALRQLGRMLFCRSFWRNQAFLQLAIAGAKSCITAGGRHTDAVHG